MWCQCLRILIRKDQFRVNNCFSWGTSILGNQLYKIPYPNRWLVCTNENLDIQGRDAVMEPCMVQNMWNLEDSFLNAKISLFNEIQIFLSKCLIGIRIPTKNIICKQVFSDLYLLRQLNVKTFLIVLHRRKKIFVGRCARIKE